MQLLPGAGKAGHYAGVLGQFTHLRVTYVCRIGMLTANVVTVFLQKNRPTINKPGDGY